MILAILFFGVCEAGKLDDARLLIRDKHYTEALRELEKALHDSPRDPEVQYEVGELLRELGAGRAAALAELAPDSAEAHQLLGRSLEARGELNAALLEYRAAVTRNAHMPGAHFSIGNIRWKQRDFEAAQPEFESELRINPQHTLAHLRLGQTLLALDQPLIAISHLRSAAAADSSLLEVHRELGKAYRALGKNSEALEEFKLVARSRPNDNSVHAQLASVYRALGDAENTSAEMKKHGQILKEQAEAGRKQGSLSAQ